MTRQNAVNDPETVSEDSVDNVLNVLLNDSVGSANEIPVDSITLLSVGTPSQGGTAVIGRGQSSGEIHAGSELLRDGDIYVHHSGCRWANGYCDGGGECHECERRSDGHDDTFSNIQEDSTTNALDVLANDSILPDVGETLTITAVNKTDGTLPGTTDQGGRCRRERQSDYKPLANFFGQDKFQYTISDGTSTDTAIVTVNVVNVNDAPIAAADLLLADERLDVADPPTELFVLANDKWGRTMKFRLTASKSCRCRRLTKVHCPNHQQWSEPAFHAADRSRRVL